LSHRGKPVQARIALSRVRNLRGSIRIECEHALLEVPLNERHHVRIRPSRENNGRAVELQARLPDVPETPWYEAYRAEIDDWLAAIRGNRDPALSGRSALPSARLIDDCYRAAQRHHLPWVEGLASRPAAAPRNGRPRRILITGASGFIG